MSQAEMIQQANTISVADYVPAHATEASQAETQANALSFMKMLARDNNGHQMGRFLDQVGSPFIHTILAMLENLYVRMDSIPGQPALSEFENQLLVLQSRQISVSHFPWPHTTVDTKAKYEDSYQAMIDWLSAENPGHLYGVYLDESSNPAKLAMIAYLSRLRDIPATW